MATSDRVPRTDEELRKLAAEAEKLGAERAKLEAEAAQLRPARWAVRTLLPTVVGAFAVAAASYWFSDSLTEESRATIRRDVLAQYFKLENTSPGKREQLLRFVESIAHDDPFLMNWVEEEGPAVATAYEKAEADETAAREEERQLGETEVRVANARDAARTALLQAGVVATTELFDRPAESIPGPLGRVLKRDTQLLLLELHDAAEAVELPDASSCSALVTTRSTLADQAAGKIEKPDPDDDYSDWKTEEDATRLSERCRGELLEWTALVAAKSRLALRDRLDEVTKVRKQFEDIQVVYQPPEDLLRQRLLDHAAKLESNG